MQNVETLRQSILGCYAESSDRQKERREKIMPSIMATLLACMHFAQTILLNMCVILWEENIVYLKLINSGS